MRPSRRQPAATGFAILALLVAIVTPVAAVERGGPPQIGTDELARDSWIVTLVDDADSAAEAPGLAQAAGGQVGLLYSYALHGFQFTGSAQAAAALERSPRVASVQADSAIYLTETLPFGVERVYAYDPGGTDGAYQQGFRGNGARIAILDTGIDLDHLDLVASIDAALGKNCINGTISPDDGYGHGTHVAGTAAAPRNSVGVVGVAPEARLVAVKMFTDSGSSSQAYALCALDHIIGLNSDADAANDIDVANMSWGAQRAWGDCTSDALHGAICRAYGAGIILVAGAGNSAVNAGSFVPAAYPEVIGVSALADFDGERGGLAGCGFVLELFANECDDSFAFFSNYGPVDVIAPGVQVYSTWAGGGYTTSSGTSMASPHIAGIAALMAAAAPGLSPEAARTALLASGECPNGQSADVDGLPGCGGQGTWPDDPDGTPEPMGHALRAAQAVAGAPPPVPVPPSAPTLSAVAGASSVELTWTAPTDDGGASVTGYQIYRGTSTAAAAPYASVGPEVTYSDTAVAPGETYWYKVVAVNSAGEGTPSNEVSATVPPVPPSSPTLSATTGDGSVTLIWTAPTDDGGAAIIGYEIYRGSSSGSATLLTTTPDLEYTDTGLGNGTTYWYEVAAENSAGVGTRSIEVSATPQAAASVASAPLTLSAQKLRDGIRLTWSAPTWDGGSSITGYVIRRTGGSGPMSFDVPTWPLVFVDDSVAPRSWYSYVATAVNGIGEGPASNEVRVRSR